MPGIAPLDPGWDVRFAPYGNIETFYAYAAETGTRRGSPEVDFGAWWWDGAQGLSRLYRVSLVVATGEIIAVASMPRPGRVLVLGRVAAGEAGRVEAEAVLAGWGEVCGAPHSLAWVVRRVADRVVGGPAVTFLLRPVDVGGHVSVAFSAGKEDARAHIGVLMFRPAEWEAFRGTLLRGDAGDAVSIDPLEYA